MYCFYHPEYGSELSEERRISLLTDALRLKVGEGLTAYVTSLFVTSYYVTSAKIIRATMTEVAIPFRIS